MAADRIVAALPGEPVSPRRRLARIAGVLYLLVGIIGAFAVAYVTATEYVPGDAAATAGNVVAACALAARMCLGRDEGYRLNRGTH